MKNITVLLTGLSLFLGMVQQALPSYQIQNPSFETGDLTGWKITGDAFAVTNDNRWSWGGPFNQDERYHVWGFKKAGDDATGTMQSSTFTLSGTGQISFLASGGINIERLYISLIRERDSKELFRVTGNEDEAYRAVEWDASEYLGDVLYFKVVDDAKGGWGHINIDGIRVFTPVNNLNNPDFAKDDLGDWSGETAAFQISDLNGTPTLHNRTSQSGSLTSTAFRLGGQGGVRFQASGDGQSSIKLLRAEDQKILFESRVTSAPQTISWDASAQLGQDLVLQIQVAPSSSIALSKLEVFRPRTRIDGSTTESDFDFKSDLSGWTQIGKTFSLNLQPTVVTSNRDGNEGTGSLLSPVFRLTEAGRIRFALSGPNDAGLYVALVRASDDRILFKASGNNKGFRNLVWDTSDFVSTNVYLRLEDQSRKGSIGLSQIQVNLPIPPGQVRRDLPNLDFETGDLSGWTVQGNAFKVGKSTSSGTGVLFGQQGKYHVGGDRNQSDAGMGSLRSLPFVLSATGKISLMVGGDNNPKVYVALVDQSDARVLFKAGGDGTDTYQTVEWDASQYLGKQVYLEVIDQSPQQHLNVDHFRVYQGLIAAWNFDEGKGSVATEQVVGQADPISYVFNGAKFKPATSPEWRTGVQRSGVHNSSLLFDGYSTFIEHDSALPKLNDALTLEAWVAPRNFEWGDGQQMSALINQHDPSTQEGFILGIGRHGRWGLQLGMGGRWQTIWADPSATLQKHQWSHLAATFSREQHRVTLYFNGREVGTLDTPVNTGLSPSSEPLLLGKHNAPVMINGVFPVNMFSGLMDDVRLYNVALPQSEIRQAYRKVLNASPKQIVPPPQTAFDRHVFQGDRFRPAYHFIAPGHWMNEPHAPIYFAGQYHLFYQQNVQGPYWHNIQWGHQVSKDLVHWRDVTEALSPSFNTAAPDGVWSGSAFKTIEGEPLLFITVGNDAAQPNQAMAIARASNWKTDPDLKEWDMPKSISIGQKADLNVGENRKVKFGDFRDPFVWREGNTWFALIGSGLQSATGTNLGGTALLYTSSDLSTWTYKSPLMTGSALKYPATGQVWELPVFLPIGKTAKGQQKYVFMINPAFAGPSPHQNKYVWYWVGNWNAKQGKFQPDHLEPRLFDYGEHFTGPSGLVDGQGRSVIFSITQDKRSEQDHYDAGWAHNAGLPLQVFLNPLGDLGVKPIKELRTLRKKPLLDRKNLNLEQANTALKPIQGNQLELELEISIPNTQSGLCVLCGADSKEATRLAFDPKNQNILIDRSRSSVGTDLGIQGGVLHNIGKSLKWHVFLDQSMIEVYVNDSKSLTSRVYITQPNSLGLKLFGDPKLKVLSLKIWSMGTAY
jgi:fructan beta-fructosidase